MCFPGFRNTLNFDCCHTFSTSSIILFGNLILPIIELTSLPGSGFEIDYTCYSVFNIPNFFRESGNIKFPLIYTNLYILFIVYINCHLIYTTLYSFMSECATPYPMSVKGFPCTACRFWSKSDASENNGE